MCAVLFSTETLEVTPSGSHYKLEDITTKTTTILFNIMYISIVFNVIVYTNCLRAGMQNCYYFAQIYFLLH